MRTPTPITVLYTEDDDPIQLPTKNELCPECNGDGSHDAWEGGMTGEEMEEMGDDFLDDYVSGYYAVPCVTCGGDKVVKVVDEDKLPPAVLEAWREQEEDRAEMYSIQAAEMAAGC